MQDWNLVISYAHVIELLYGDREHHLCDITINTDLESE